MYKTLSVVLVIGGIALLIYGYNASESLASSFSKIFNGNPSDRSMWLMAGGIVAIAIGSAVGIQLPTKRRP